MNLGKSLRIALAIKGMKRKDLAEALKTSNQQISNWIRTGTIKQSNIVAICKALDMQVSEFIALGE